MSLNTIYSAFVYLVLTLTSLGSAIAQADQAVQGAALKFDVTHAEVLFNYNERPPRPVVSIGLTEQSSRDLGRFTQAHVGQIIEILVDGDVIMAPRVNEPFFGLTLYGNFTLQQAEAMAARLSAHTSQMTIRRRGP